MLKEQARLFKSLSDPNRLRIIKMLQQRPMCVCEIKNVLGLANATVSNHLKVLREAGFVVEEKDGKWINYLLNRQTKDNNVNSLLSILNLMINDDETIKTDGEKVSVADRYEICGSN